MAQVCDLPLAEDLNVVRTTWRCSQGGSKLTYAPYISKREATMEEYKKLMDASFNGYNLARTFVPSIEKTFSYSISQLQRVFSGHKRGPAKDQMVSARTCCTKPVGMNPKLSKYWNDRHKLFYKFDEGIQLDEEGLYSVTPEALAHHQASRCAPGSWIVDGFTGVGGNAIQFALMGHHLIAIDLDPQKIQYAKLNARIYGVEKSIEFIVGDFFRIAPKLYADMMFLSPPWGGLEYPRKCCYDIETMLRPKDGQTLFRTAHKVSPKVMIFLPRNTNLFQLEQLPICVGASIEKCEVELNYVDGRPIGVTAYYGNFP